MVIALVVIGGICVLSAVIYSYWRNQKRIQSLQQFCLGKGWQFSARDDSYCVRWQGEPFFVGRNRAARDVIAGTTGSAAAGRRFVAFDYSYVTDQGSGQQRSSTTHYYAVCAIELPTYLPALRVTPDNALLRAGNLLTGSDIELESEEFNRRFRVECPDAKFACDVLPPRTMEALLARTPLHFRIEGRDLLCWETGRTQIVPLLERIATLTAFVDGIPSFVWHDYGPEQEAAIGPEMG